MRTERDCPVTGCIRIGEEVNVPAWSICTVFERRQRHRSGDAETVISEGPDPGAQADRSSEPEMVAHTGRFRGSGFDQFVTSSHNDLVR